MTNLSLFHLAIVVQDIALAREFYGNYLGCPEGRSDEHWVDFDFFGHQLVCHLGVAGSAETNKVDGDAVPVPHFGVVLPIDEWRELADRLDNFVLPPKTRFPGQPGEQGTFFILDPFGNALEFKGLSDYSSLFAK